MFHQRSVAVKYPIPGEEKGIDLLRDKAGHFQCLYCPFRNNDPCVIQVSFSLLSIKVVPEHRPRTTQKCVQSARQRRKFLPPNKILTIAKLWKRQLAAQRT